MKIFAIDDDPLFLKVMETMFRHLDHTMDVVFHSNPEDALSELSLHQPDILFLDLYMPKMSGWEFLDRIQTLNFSNDIYILSSSVDQNDKLKAGDYTQIKEFISKPLRMTNLKEILNLN